MPPPNKNEFPHRGLPIRRLAVLGNSGYTKGHAAGRSFGTKTREWQLDTVIIGTKQATSDDKSYDLAIKLEFTKAWLRTPNNRNQFEPVTLLLSNDEWSHSLANTQKRKNRHPWDRNFIIPLSIAYVTSGSTYQELVAP
jgi:hypothetical protein